MFRRALTISCACLLVWCIAALVLDTWGKTRRPDGFYDAIIVAGCSVYQNGKPSPALEWRVRMAVDLWKLGTSTRVVFTGGMGDFPPTEAEAGAALAAELGLPESAMTLEKYSKSTLQNAQNAASILPGAAQMRVLVVTDAYHVFRARRLFAGFFHHAEAVGSTYGVWSRFKGAMREVLALVKYALNQTRFAPDARSQLLDVLPRATFDFPFARSF